MRNARSSVALIVVVAATAACSSPRETVWSSEALASPNGRWIAQQMEVAYDRGLFSEYGRIVEVRRGDGSPGRTVLALDGDWRAGKPAVDAVRLRWANDGTLESIVPNLTECYRPVPDYEGIVVRVLYREDDPLERREWLRKRWRWADSR